MTTTASEVFAGLALESVDVLRAGAKDPGAAAELLELIRWPEGVVCPACGGADTRAIRGRASEARRLMACRREECGAQFSWRSGTVFAGSPNRPEHILAAMREIAETGDRDLAAAAIRREFAFGVARAEKLVDALPDWRAPEPIIEKEPPTEEVAEPEVHMEPRPPVLVPPLIVDEEPIPGAGSSWRLYAMVGAVILSVALVGSSGWLLARSQRSEVETAWISGGDRRTVHTDRNPGESYAEMCRRHREAVALQKQFFTPDAKQR